MLVESSEQQQRSLQFNIDFHRNEARQVNTTPSLEEYGRKKEQFLAYIPFNIETALGERFNVGISRFEYEMQGGQLWGKDMNEPAIDSFRRGRDYRRKTGNPLDHPREDAEIEGFEKMQDFLTDPNTKAGSMMLSVSPKGQEGSSYGHNFYDVLILKEDAIGKRYVEARRYASGLKVEEYSALLAPFGADPIDEDHPDVSFLKNPIKIPPIFTPDDLHYYLHKEQKVMGEEKFQIINKHCEQLKKEFAKSLLDNPNNNREHEKIYNAILNKADELDRRIDAEGIDMWRSIKPVSSGWAMRQDINEYSKKIVREVITGCGVSAGFGVEKNKTTTPMSVAEFGKKWEYHKGNCIVCRKRDLEVGPCNICKKCEKKFDEEGIAA